MTMCQEVAEATRSQHVAVHLGNIDPTKYLRTLAKTGHAFACAVIGRDAFEPYLLDVILHRSDEVSYFAGDDTDPASIIDESEHSFQIFLGVPENGPIAGNIVVRMQLYPSLKSPVHLIVVGRPNEITGQRLQGLQDDQ